MNPIDRRRLRVPNFFQSPELESSRRDLLQLFLASPEKREQSRISPVFEGFDARFSDEVRDAFHWRCAFCEDDAPGSAMRLRPETEAEPVKDPSVSHLYYAWLSTSWDNWYWVCHSCRPENERHYPLLGRRAALPRDEDILRFCDSNAIGLTPISQAFPQRLSNLPVSWSMLPGPDSRGGERPLFLDPCRDRIWKHLAVGPRGELIALSRRGKATIDHYKLWRPELEAARAEAVGALHQGMAERRRLEPEAYADGVNFQGIIKLRIGAIAEYLAMENDLQVPTGWRAIVRLFRDLSLVSFYEQQWHAALDYDPTHRQSLAAQNAARAASDAYHQEQPDVALSVLPRLVHFELHNFKSLEQLSFAVGEYDLRRTGPDTSAAAGSLLILGENATGKSSILEGAVLCLSNAAVRDAIAPSPQRFVLDPKFMDPGIKAPPRKARLRALFSDRSRAEIVIRDGRIEQNSGHVPYPLFAYGAFRQYLKGAPATLPEDHSVATLFHGDRLLPNPTDWLISLPTDRFKMVARSLGSIFAIEDDYDIIEIEDRICYIVTRYLYDGVMHRERTPLDTVSSGFRAILAMTCDIMRGLMEWQDGRYFQSLTSARGIVFIDEIEAHLHPRWKLAIMSSLREALPNITFIVTSHDPLCLRGMASGEVMVLNRVRGIKSQHSDLPIFIETLDALPKFEELTIEQLLTADFFQLNSTSSQQTDREYARIAELLRRQATAEQNPSHQLNDAEKSALRSFTREVNTALPVGDTEVQRLVQDAVAIYLRDRATETREGLATLRASTRDRIIAALKTI